MKKIEKYSDLKKRLYTICAIAFAVLYALYTLALEPLYVSVSSNIASSDALSEILYYSCIALERLAIYFGYAVVIFGVYRFGARSFRPVTLIFLAAAFFKYLSKTVVSWVYLGAIPSSWYVDLLDILYFAAIEMIEFLIIRVLASKIIEKRRGEATSLTFEGIYHKENPLLRAAAAASFAVLAFDLFARIFDDVVAIAAYGPPEKLRTVILMLLHYLLTLLSGLICYVILSYILYTFYSRYKELD